jgi:hypothetical protein
MGRLQHERLRPLPQRHGWPKAIRPYNLRHTVGLTLSERGVDLGDISAHMGHSSMDVTRQFYVPALLSRLRAASARSTDGSPAWRTVPSECHHHAAHTERKTRKSPAKRTRATVARDGTDGREGTAKVPDLRIRGAPGRIRTCGLWLRRPSVSVS